MHCQVRKQHNCIIFNSDNQSCISFIFPTNYFYMITNFEVFAQFHELGIPMDPTKGNKNWA